MPNQIFIRGSETHTIAAGVRLYLYELEDSEVDLSGPFPKTESSQGEVVDLDLTSLDRLVEIAQGWVRSHVCFAARATGFMTAAEIECFKYRDHYGIDVTPTPLADAVAATIRTGFTSTPTEENASVETHVESISPDPVSNL
jgi:hypothetical protein